MRDIDDPVYAICCVLDENFALLPVRERQPIIELAEKIYDRVVLELENENKKLEKQINEAYDEGYDAGYNEGYDEGYDDGKDV